MRAIGRGYGTWRSFASEKGIVADGEDLGGGFADAAVHGHLCRLHLHEVDVLQVGGVACVVHGVGDAEQVAVVGIHRFCGPVVGVAPAEVGEHPVLLLAGAFALVVRTVRQQGAAQRVARAPVVGPKGIEVVLGVEFEAREDAAAAAVVAPYHVGARARGAVVGDGVAAHYIGIVPGRAFQFVPCVVREAVAVLVLHDIDDPRLG